MKMSKAIELVRQYDSEMNVAASLAEVASQRYAGHMELFNAAVRMGDDKEAEAQRLALHAQLDAILDNGHVVHSRKRLKDKIMAGPLSD